MADSMLAAAALIVLFVWGWQAAVCILFSALVLSGVFVSEIRGVRRRHLVCQTRSTVFFMGKNTGIWNEYSEGELGHFAG